MSNSEAAQWGIVELMGHKVVAGRISKSEEFGTVLLRIDVPATDSFPEFTQMYGNSAIYCVTFTSEDVARIAAQRAKVNPVSIYAPELITKEQLEQTIDEWRKRVDYERRLQSGSNDEEPGEKQDDDRQDNDES